MSSLPIMPDRPPPFDVELAPAVEVIRTRVEAPLLPGGIDRARTRARTSALTDEELALGGLYTIAETRAVRPDGSQARFVVCTPALPRAAGPGRPAICHIHGGGLVAGHPRSRELLHDLARAAPFRAVVVSVDYRLAPEFRYPTALQDCAFALDWMIAQAPALGLDPELIVVSGNSAGAGLAATLAVHLRDRGGPSARGFMLQCPMLDATCTSASAYALAQVGIWDGQSNRTGWSAYLGEIAVAGSAACAAGALGAGDLSGLPPVFVDAGSAEALRDEAVAFAARIWAVGGQAELHVWSGGFHSFDQWVPEARISQGAEAARRNWLLRVLSP